MAKPRIIVTGASGFVGRHLLDEVKECFHIDAFARRSQARCGAPVHPNINWTQVDIAELEPLTAGIKADPALRRKVFEALRGSSQPQGGK